MTLLARAAVAGFGASAGRDVYNTMKKQGGLLILLAIVAAAVALPFLGGRQFTRGHDRGMFLTLLLTICGSLVLISVGACAAIAVDMTVQTFSPRAEGAPLIQPRFDYISIVVGASAALGLLVGLMQRGRRLRTFAITRDNEAFLIGQGIVETGGKDVTHRDAEGTPLRLLEATGDNISFMVVGRRGKRAFISLDPDGRMLSYSGVPA